MFVLTLQTELRYGGYILAVPICLVQTIYSSCNAYFLAVAELHDESLWPEWGMQWLINHSY